MTCLVCCVYFIQLCLWLSFLSRTHALAVCLSVCGLVRDAKGSSFMATVPPFSGASSTATWPTRIVVVVASFNGTLLKPDRRRNVLWRTQHDPLRWHRNTSNLTFVVYQRTNPRGVNYSPNFGFEGGVVIQFIAEHYNALPDVTVFMQERPEQHNPQWTNWLGCMRPNVTYAPMTHARLARLYRANAQTDPGTERDDAITEQCWRDMLDAFGSPLLLPREQPVIGYFQGATFAASRDLLRATPHRVWKRIHLMMAGGDGRCHRGPLQWERLSTPRHPHTRTLDVPTERGKHTSANAFEALHHALIGGMGKEDVFGYDYCHAFVPDCYKSPCGRVRLQLVYVKQMRGRIEHERRRLGREYNRILSGIRHVAEAARRDPGGGGGAEHGMGAVFRAEFGNLLGLDAANASRPSQKRPDRSRRAWR